MKKLASKQEAKAIVHMLVTCMNRAAKQGDWVKVKHFLNRRAAILSEAMQQGWDVYGEDSVQRIKQAVVGRRITSSLVEAEKAYTNQD